MRRKKTVIFVLAFLGIVSSIWAIKRGTTPPPKTPPIASPPEKPYSTTIAASGLIEAFGDNVAIGSPTQGVVQEVYVKVWQQVKKGDPLFKIDSRELDSELKIAEAKEQVTQAECRRIQDQLSRLRSIKNTRAISQEELCSKENEASVALATFHQMGREREKITTLLDRLTVRSPMDATVLQSNIRVGEYLATNTDRPPLMLGNTRRLQIKADIDEHNASHMTNWQEAIAYPKNRPNYSIPLTLVRIEPYVVPKLSLTGSSREKVDTRVLQIIYAFDPPQDISLYIGQQVDIFIKRDMTHP
jgi:HlyD family secretion protein